jgi:DNA polymerase III subunit delta'
VTFSDIIGHKEVIKALSASLTDAKTGHAYLFLGPAGVGKKTLAREFAKNLLCPEQQENPEGFRSCQQFEVGLHPDFITIVPNGNSIKIEQLRDMQHNAYLRPVHGTHKVFFFPEAEQLTEAAANSFLKILEEPPSGVVFLFAAVRADSILPTIRSRCQVYQLFPVPSEEIINWLKNKGFPESEAIRRAMACQGIPGATLDGNGETTESPRIKLSELWERNLLELLKVTTELEKKERREVLVLLQEWQAEVRINMIQTAEAANCSSDKIAELLFCVEKLTKAIMMVESNVNLRLVIEEFFLALKVHAKYSFSSMKGIG